MDLDAIEAEALQALQSAADLADLESVRVGVLGKKGSLKQVLRSLGSMPAEETGIRPRW